MGPAVASVLNGETTIDEFAATICDEANKAFPEGAAAAAPPADAVEETVELRWRTRPDNQAEIDVYQSVSDGIDIPGVALTYEPGGSETSSYQDVLEDRAGSGHRAGCLLDSRNRRR